MSRSTSSVSMHVIGINPTCGVRCSLIDTIAHLLESKNSLTLGCIKYVPMLYKINAQVGSFTLKIYLYCRLKSSSRENFQPPKLNTANSSSKQDITPICNGIQANRYIRQQGQMEWTVWKNVNLSTRVDLKIHMRPFPSYLLSCWQRLKMSIVCRAHQELRDLRVFIV